MLQPEHLKIDDRSIQQLLKDLLKTYRKIPFEENGKELGKWDQLLKDQLLFFWVDIHEIKLGWWQKERDLIIKNWDSSGKVLSASYLNKLVQTFYRWFTKAESYLQIWVIKELESCVTSLNFETLQQVLQQLPEPEKALDTLEKLKKRRRSDRIENAVGQQNREEVDQFEEVTNLLLNCLLQIQKELKNKDWDELISTERHPPHLGLLYGFLKAYQKVQGQFNELPQRHLDYYYKEILQQEPAGARPDEAYLFFQLNKEVESFVLPQGTVLAGEPDEYGNPIEFETIATSYLTNAIISEIKTLLVHASDKIAPLNRIDGVTGVYHKTIDTALAVNYLPEKKGWALFGEPSKEDQADLGWAWASPAFNSTGGEREYELEFELTEESATSCRQLVQQLADQERLSAEELFFNFFDHTFLIRITGLSGWVNIDRYSINFLDFLKATSDTLKMNFTLSAFDDAWVANDVLLHGEHYPTVYPILEVKLKGDSVYYPYSFLQRMEWKSLGIHLDVKECKELVLFNKHGLIDSESPFPVFGVTPLKEDEFSIGCREWMDKSLTSVDIVLDWVPLPQPNFTDYYQEYNTIELKDEKFQIIINEALETKSYPLFQLDEKEELINQTALLDIPVTSAAKIKSNRLDEVLRPNEVPSAFINLNLISPEEGFGSNHYNNELILFAQEKARDRKNKLNLLPPKIPYVPYAKGLTVNYRSSNTAVAKAIDNGNGAEPFDFFHIHPHGIDQVASDEEILNHSLIPTLENRGYLYLGLEGLVIGAALCLYVKLEQSNETIEEAVDFRIEYLVGKIWTPLRQDDILENSIEFGLNSGMITFRTPIDIRCNHPFYSSEKNWIRISIQEQNIVHVGNCLLIKPNCSRVKRTNIDESEHIERIPPETIVSFKKRPRQIETVSQPMPSFGGKEREDESNLYERVSQHLAHKNRMVRPRDFERMLFEEFDGLAWIKVATASEYPESVKAGEVHLIVLPTFVNLEDIKQLSLQSEQKESIENFVKKHSYPGIKVKVFSPQIEQVEVCVDMMLNRLLETPSLDEISDLIDRTVSPWAFAQGQIKNVDSSFNTIDVLNQLNKMPSVWKIEVCEAVQLIRMGTHYDYIDSAESSELLKPSTYRSILVPAVKHKVRFINRSSESKEDNTIGNMIIGTDLIIRAHKEEREKTTPVGDENHSLYLVSTNQKNT